MKVHEIIGDLMFKAAGSEVYVSESADGREKFDIRSIEYANGDVVIVADGLPTYADDAAESEEA